MNVLVVGGTGFLGTHLCRELVARGHHVTALSRTPGDADLPPEVDRVAGDVTAYDSIEGAFEGQDAVVFLTALSVLFKPKGGDERHFEVHLGGTENAVRAAEEHGVRKYVQISNIGADPDEEVAFFRAKGLAERVVENSDLDWTIIRPSLLYGDDPEGEFISFTKLLAPPYVTPLPGGGKTKFQPIWVEEFVPIIADAVEGKAPERGEEAAEAGATGAEEGGPTGPHVGKIYEIGGPEVLTLADVARLAHAAEGRPVNVISIPMPLVGIGLKLLDKVPRAPFGADQYRSLKFANVAEENDVSAFGVDPSELRTVADYLGVDPSVLGPERA